MQRVACWNLSCRKYTEGWQRAHCVPGVGRWEGQGAGACLKIPTAAWHSKPGGAGPLPALQIQEWQGLPGCLRTVLQF